MTPRFILGISAHYHDSAACLIKDGNILSAAQEERFTRIKHDASFPHKAIEFCLKKAGIEMSDVEVVTYYDKPFLKFERLLETYLSNAPCGYKSFLKSMPLWIKEKLFIKENLKKELRRLCGNKPLPQVQFTEHHQSHASSAFYPSPFENAAVLCLDGVGEWTTTSAWEGTGHELNSLWEIHFPHSLGLLYSAFTYYTGFKVNSGEYKVMGLAPYGEPRYVTQIKDHLIDIKADGSYQLNRSYFDYEAGLKMTSSKFHKLFGGLPRKPESEITQKEMDLARSVQEVIEEVVLKLASSLQKETRQENLCLAGGVALNCVANGKLQRSGIFKNIWIQPASGDAGGSLGAALASWHQKLEQKRQVSGGDSMSGSYLGPNFTNSEISEFLDSNHIPYKKLSEADTTETVADLLAQENVVGWFSGRMEFGPRALGARSILGDPRSDKMQSTMNLKIKYRESFRPFAPAVLREDLKQYFQLSEDSPYMLLVTEINDSIKKPSCSSDEELFGIEKLKVKRSELPAITHVDNSCRVQTVHEDTHPQFYQLLKDFKKKTGCSVLINTSFNVRGEPIVCTPEDAYRCFMNTKMDYLVLENFLLKKKEQPLNEETSTEFDLD